MTFDNYKTIVGKLQDKSNLLFLVTLTLGTYDLVVAYQTFSHLNSLPKGNTNYKSLKAPTAMADFFFVGTQDETTVLLMQPEKLMYANSRRSRN
jgi:hypothetical protein